MSASFTPASLPTMYFIGVTTRQSSINRVFPQWAERLGLGDCRLVGMDFKLHDDPAKYREAVNFIKEDPLSLGALVTTHKIDLFQACRDLFDEIDPLAALMGETSSLSKRSDDGGLLAKAVDPLTSTLALEAFMPPRHWEETRAEVLVLGAGGSSIAVTWSLMHDRNGVNRPSKITVANRSEGRLRAMEKIHADLGFGVPISYELTPTPDVSDALCDALPPGSLVINATGLGKDAPGSPLTDAARFPENGYVWEFNYRGDLLFLEQAKAQAQERHLHLEDGWTYFLHGWTRVIADVFHVDIPTSGPLFDELSRLASEVRG